MNIFKKIGLGVIAALGIALKIVMWMLRREKTKSKERETQIKDANEAVDKKIEIQEQVIEQKHKQEQEQVNEDLQNNRTDQLNKPW